MCQNLHYYTFEIELEVISYGDSLFTRQSHQIISQAIIPPWSVEILFNVSVSCLLRSHRWGVLSIGRHRHGVDASPLEAVAVYPSNK